MMTSTLSPPARMPALRRLWRRVRPTLRREIKIRDLPDQTLRDIGIPDDRRFAIVSNREARLSRLRAQAQGGPFFIPPA